jgi:hypothetical protein
MKMSVEKMFSQLEKRSRVETLYWAGVLIWAGLVFGASSLGSLPQIGSADAWSWVFLGAGLYGTTLNIYYASSPDTMNPLPSDYIWSGFWLLVGLSGFLVANIFWPIALLVVGAVVLINALR